MTLEVDNANDDLLTRMRSGQEAAFEQFVVGHSGRMLSVAKRLLRDDHLAADAVQDAFLAAFKGLDQFAGHSTLGTWLHRIVINVCLMKMRSRASHADVSLDELLPKFDQTGHHVKRVCAWSGPGQESLEEEENRQLIRKCIDQLPDDYRTIIMLRDIEGLDTGETARILEISMAVTKTRLHRARQALRTMLEPHFTK